MGDEFFCELVAQPAPAAISQPPVVTPAPEPLSAEQLQSIDAAFAVPREDQAAAGIMAVWVAGPLLVDRAGDHLGKKKREEAD